MAPGFRRDLCADAIAALSALREDGWCVSDIEWENQAWQTVRFTAKKGAQGLFCVCFDVDLAKRLQALL
jgi:hypothetical protein